MNNERYLGLPFQAIKLPDGHQIIRLQNVYGSGDVWPSLTLANHNVFRLNADNQVVWQVRRVENPTHASWEELHVMAKAKDPSCEGYFDPFWGMSMGDEQGKYDPGDIYRPGCRIYLQTRWWAYSLDPETGIATCTGDQVK